MWINGKAMQQPVWRDTITGSSEFKLDWIAGVAQRMVRLNMLAMALSLMDDWYVRLTRCSSAVCDEKAAQSKGESKQCTGTGTRARSGTLRFTFHVSRVAGLDVY